MAKRGNIFNMHSTMNEDNKSASVSAVAIELESLENSPIN